jgi:Protein of unknown function (DUF992)
LKERNMVERKVLGLAAAMVLCLGAPAALGQPRERPAFRIGTLQCDVSGGIGMIVGSSRELDCVFRQFRRGRERYRGAIRHAGLDIGATTRGVMVWSVFARSRTPRSALAGRYAGASAEASLGLGLGANVLVGGSADSIALQPVSVQAQVGLNIAIGVAEITLAPVRGRRGGQS